MIAGRFDGRFHSILNRILVVSSADREGEMYSLPLRTTVRVRDRCSDLRIWPARQMCRTSVLMICGNPGLIDYYTAFLSSLHRHLPDDVEIMGLGHEGHSPENPLPLYEAVGFGRGLPSLQDQIDRKIDFIDQLRARKVNKPTKIVLIGHSVGAYICQEILRARPAAIHSVYGLFPTIADIATSPNGIRLIPLFNPLIRTVTFLLLHLLNAITTWPLLHWLVRFSAGQHRPASIVTTQFIASPSVVAATLRMAGDEMLTIKTLDTDCGVILNPSRSYLTDLLSVYQKHGHKVTLYFAAGDADRWVGNSAQVQNLCKTVDLGKSDDDTRKRWHICTDGMVHAFCLEHSESMARYCAKWMSADIPR